MAEKYDISDFKNAVRAALNHEFLVGLSAQSRVNKGGNTETFDFTDMDKQFFVQVVENYSSQNRNTVRTKIKYNHNFVNRFQGPIFSKLVFVFASRLSKNDKQYFQSFIDSNDLKDIYVYDESDIRKLLRNHELIDESEKYSSFIGPDDNIENDDSEAMGDLVDNTITEFQELNAQIFVGGHTWTDDNLLQTFIAEKRWENGKEDRNTQAVNSARVGDIVLMKSTFAKEGESFLRIKAIGTVTGNRQDGHNLDMQWTQLGDFIDIPGLGHLRNTFQLVKQKYYTALFKALVERNPALIDQIIRYVEEVRKNNTNKTENGQNNSGGGNDTPPPHETFSGSESPENEDDNKNTRITSIANDFGNKDSLDFEKDVRAFAALIAFKEMKPPLAIVLFGRWGSGKSFFMNQLELKIRELAKYQRFDLMDESQVNYQTGLFHQGIAHIKFNAWSYMDANLWAGFAHSLFEKLNEYITQNTKGSIERLKVSVKISKRLEKLHGKKEELEGKKEKLEKLKKELEEEKEKRILRIFSGRYDGPIKNYLEKCGYEEDEIKLLTPSSIQKRIKSGIRFAKYFRNNAIEFAGFGIAAILIWLFSKSVLFDHLFQGIAWLSDHTFMYLLAVLAFITPFARFINKRKKAIAEVIALMEELKKTKQKTNYTDEINKLYFEIDDIDKLISEIEESEHDEKIKASDPTQTAIEEFIDRQANSEDYKEHLGIITTIRKDFETLSELFAFREAENEKLFSDKENQEEKELIADREIIKNSFNEGRKLERIVLYIDDLDRCTDEKVIEVLEAVHLLMAFPLFTVVVGVDERSVKNALIMRQIKRYQNLGDSVFENRKKLGIHGIKPIEYLEKIFQIPFQLPIASTDGTSNLLLDTIGDVIAEEVIEVDLVVGEDEELVVEKVYEEDSDQVIPNQIVESGEEEIEDFEPEMIQITDFEQEYLQKCLALVGTNPRTIKRYVNIYRICKVHEYNRMRDKRRRVEIIFLLALFIGKYRTMGVQIFNTKSEDQVSLEGYFENEIFEEIEVTLEEWLDQDEYLGPILSLRPEELETSLKFIRRFSYNSKR